MKKRNDRYYNRIDEIEDINILSDLEYEEYIENALDDADKEAEDPNTKYYSHEEFKQMARRINSISSNNNILHTNL